jgi:drug/metabolite transporter (DMT)-like permease
MLLPLVVFVNNPTGQKTNPALIILAFGCTYIIWGTTYLAVLFGLKGFSPFLLSALRFAVAGALLMIWCKRKKNTFPRKKDLSIVMISGILMLVGGTGLVTWAEQYIGSGQAAVITATEPFLFLLLDKKRWSFYFSQKSIVAGLLIGFGGLSLFMLFGTTASGARISAHDQWIGNAALLLSTLLWVVGSLYSKTTKQAGIPLMSIVAVQLLAAAAFSGLISVIRGEGFDPDAVTGKALWSLAYLTIFGSIIAFVAFSWLLTVRPAAQVSTHTYINPIIAILAGWFFAGEPLGLVQGIGLVIVLLGVILTNKSRSVQDPGQAPDHKKLLSAEP